MIKIKLMMVVWGLLTTVAFFIFLRSLDNQSTWKITASIIAIGIGLFFLIQLIIKYRSKY